MGFKKLLSAVMACGLIITSLVAQPVGVQASDATSAFQSITLSESYKKLTENNPCSTLHFSADPGVMEYNGRIYVYATNDGDATVHYSSDNTYSQINTLTCMSSSDMVNWTDHGIIKVAGSSGAAKWAGNSWAPYAVHKTINGKEKFFLYFANNANGIGVLTADSPTGPWTDPIGKALVSRSTANCSNVTWLFDPAVLVDTDGSGYLYFGGGVPTGQSANPKTARVVKLGSDMTSLAGTPITIDAPYIFEDSGINKIGNTYYYSYCTNWSCSNPGAAQIAYMTSSSPTGPFTYQGAVLKNPGTYFGAGLTGNNHHTFYQFKNQWYIFYHTLVLDQRMNGTQHGYRTTQVDKMNYSNGAFSMGTASMTGVTQVSDFNPYVSNKMATMAWQGGVALNGSGDSTQIMFNRGDWVGVSDVGFGTTGAKSITMKAASANGAYIKICSGSPSGAVIGYVEIPSTGSNYSYKTVTASINTTTGTKDLFFVASGDCAVDTWQFTTDGNTSVDEPTTSTAPSNTGETVILPDGWYYIKNVNAQKYLQVTDNTGKAGQNVEIGTGTGVAGQEWYLTNTSDGYITLTSALGDFMLDVANAEDADGANIQIYNAYAGDAQKFIIKATSTDGVYTIGTKASNVTKMLDVYNFGKEDGTNVCQWTFGGYSNQQWIFEKTNYNAPTTSSNPSTSTGLPSGVTCEYSVVSDWGNSFQAQIVLSNNSSNTYNGWNLSFDYNSTINNLWGAELVSQTGTKVVVTNPSWDTTLAPGGSVTINFTADLGSDKNTPTNYSFN